MTTKTPIASVIDRDPWGRYRLRLLATCFLIVLMDGFDTQAIGFAAKSMSSVLGIPLNRFGQVFSAGLFGAMLGALALGLLSDRHGRRRMLLGCIALFGVCSLLTAFARGLPDLLAYRFLAGLGLGGAIPNLLALASEYTPRHRRGLLTGVLYAGFPLGGVLGAVVSAQVIPALGWQTIFYIGGIAPLLMVGVAAVTLPESLQFLLRRADGQSQVRRIVKRIAPGLAGHDTEYADTDEQVAGQPMRHLFTAGRALPTLQLWVAFFMCFVLLIVLVLWTPALLREAGLTGPQSAWIVGFINLGSVVGTALGGKLVDRLDKLPILSLLFVLGAASVACLGALPAFQTLAVFALLSGFLVGAGSSGLLTLAVVMYPSGMRGTAVGWAMAMGRFGQVLGPLAVGALLASGLSVDRIFFLCAVPAGVAACLALPLRARRAAGAAGRVG